jgi:hypothetical protein
MPEARPPAKRRATRGKVRAWAWLLGTFSFLAPWTILGLSPKPPADASAAPAVPKRPTKTQRPVVMVITKKVIVTDPAAPSTPVRTTSGSAAVHYVYAPAPAAPVTVSCGTHPC